MAFTARFCGQRCSERSRLANPAARAKERAKWRRIQQLDGSHIPTGTRLPRSASPGERFWAKVDHTPTCWIWSGSRDGKGYGLFWDGDRQVRAHRFAYELLREPIPDGLTIDHLCRVTSCVNPDHMEVVTVSENVRRGLAHR